MRRTRRFPFIQIFGRRIVRPLEALLPPPEGCFDYKPMPQIPIIMPQLGESIAEATVINFLVNAGDQVETDQDVLEVETNKATMNVTSPCRGRVEKLLVKLNESYPVGAVLGYLDASKGDAARLGLDAPEPSAPRTEGATDFTNKTP